MSSVVQLPLNAQIDAARVLGVVIPQNLLAQVLESHQSAPILECIHTHLQAHVGLQRERVHPGVASVGAGEEGLEVEGGEGDVVPPGASVSGVKFENLATRLETDCGCTEHVRALKGVSTIRFKDGMTAC